MNATTALNAYSQHTLSIDIRTSSGDLIELDFNNEKSLQYAKGNERESFAFSSTESFSFHYEGNGIDAQDRKEIEAFLKIAQPNIDNFVAGLNEGSSLTQPINKLAQDITSLFTPFKDPADHNQLNFIKHGLTKGVDKALSEYIHPEEQTQKVLSHAQRFLEQMIKQLDKAEELLYG